MRLTAIAYSDGGWQHVAVHRGATRQPIERVIDESDDDLVWLGDDETTAHGEGFVLRILAVAVRNLGVTENAPFDVSLDEKNNRIASEVQAGA